MKNPYETLNVDKDATPQDIKKSYRSKSKKAHPDTGGSVEEFSELSNAYELLCSPDERAYYDEHGSEKPKKVGIQEQALIVISKAINEIIDNFDDSTIIYQNLVERIETAANGKLSILRTMISEQEKAIKKIQKMNKVFEKRLTHKRVKINSNIFVNVIKQRESVIKRSIDDFKEQEQVLISVIDIINDFDFQFDDAVDVSIDGASWSFSTATY